MWNRETPRGGRFTLKPATLQSIRKWLEKWGLILFVSAWTFTLGVLAGRGSAPVEFDIGALERELAALKDAEMEAEIQRFKINADPAEDSPELDFHEALKTAGEEPTALQPVPLSEPSRMESGFEETGEDVEAEGPAAAPVEIKKRAVPGKAVAKAARNPENSPVKPATLEKTASAQTSGAPPAPAPPEKADQHLTIQVASFKNAREADVKVEHLKGKGYPAYKIIGKVPGKGIWHRVRVGRFTSRSEAAAVMDRLKKDRQSVMLVNLD